MRKGEPVFNKGTKWIAGKDGCLSFWIDKWMGKGPLQNLISGPLNRSEESLWLKDVIKPHGWNWAEVSFSFPRNLKLGMKATLIPLSFTNPDLISWSSSSNEFELKEAYRLPNADAGQVAPFNEEWVWKMPTLPKIKCFIWQCCNHSIQVREIFSAREMDLPTSWPLRNGASESISMR